MKNQPLLDLPKREPSPHEASGMADLITPNQREGIKGLCRHLKTSPQVETAAMFGEGVNFYQLTKRSARALALALRSRLTLDAFQQAHDHHNAPDHDKQACALCASYEHE